jgi:phosphate transport system substrate-binding protein
MRFRALPLVLAAFAFLGTGASCGGDDGDDDLGAIGLAGRIQTDGSSTVAPFTELAANRFVQEHSGVSIIVSIIPSGTGGGFERFCRRGIDLLNASRPIEADEQLACRERGIEFFQFQVASDALTVAINPENDWADCLTVAELKKIWEPGSTVDRWNDVRPGFPDERLELFGRGTGSGTFDYFTEVIVGEEGASRGDYRVSEDDFGTVDGVASTTGGMGYFGLSYFSDSQDRLKALEIDGGSGCVAPSVETAQNGEYRPLSRPLFVYVKRQSLERPAVRRFVEVMIDDAQTIAEDALFVPLTDSQLRQAQAAFDEAARQTGG